MSFAYDRERKQIVDPATGDVLEQFRLHYQDLRWYQTILGPDGRKKFAATILIDADGTLANPRKRGDHVLASAVRIGPDGKEEEVSGRDRDVRRILEYIRSQTDPAKRFTASDKRRGYLSIAGPAVDYRFALAMGVVGLVALLLWKGI